MRTKKENILEKGSTFKFLQLTVWYQVEMQHGGTAELNTDMACLALVWND